MARQDFGPEHPDTLRTGWLVARILADAGRLDAARTAFAPILPKLLALPFADEHRHKRDARTLAETLGL